MSNQEKFWCPHPWRTLSAKADGHLRVCCLADYANPNPVKNAEGEILRIDNLKNLDEYFNSPGLVKLRQEMIDGGRPEMCRRCWELEDAGGMTERTGLIQGKDLNTFLENTNPDGTLIESKVKYIDFAFSNQCNLKCKMCTPWASDQLVKEFTEMNMIPVDMKFDFKNLWAFDKNGQAIMEQVMKTLEDFIIVGGEPLINQDLIKCLKFLSESGYSKNIFLRITTNLTVLPDQFFEIISKFRWVHFIVSIDGIGDAYNYVRYPGKWDKIEKNLQELLSWDNPNFQVEITSCLMSWNLHSIPDLLTYFSRFAGHPKMREWVPWFNYVFGPDYARPEAVPMEYRKKYADDIKAAVSRMREIPCSEMDTMKLDALIGLSAKMLEETLPHAEAEFIKFTDAQDKIRKMETKKYLPFY